MKIENFKKVKTDKYQCGSPNLCKFLEDNGIKYSDMYVHKNSRTIWVFAMSEKLSGLLKQWSENKISKGGSIC